MIFVDRFNKDEVKKIVTHDRRRCNMIDDQRQNPWIAYKNHLSYQSKSGDWKPMNTGHISVDNRAFASRGLSNPKTHY